MTSIRLTEVVSHIRSAATAAEIPIGSLVLGLEDVVAEVGILRLPERISEPVGSNKNAFAAGDILFGRLRPTLRKVAVAPEGGYCTPEMVVLRAIDIEDTWYLWSVLRGASVSSVAASLVAGASLPRISPKDLLQIEIPWPDRAARRRIADQARTLHRVQMHLVTLGELVREADAALSLSLVQVAEDAQ